MSGDSTSTEYTIGSAKQSFFSYDYFGMNILVLAVICVLVIAACVMEVLPTSMIGAMAICMVFGLIMGVIGDRIPVWKDFFGGGAILCYFGAAALVKFNMIPEKTIESVNNFIGGYDFLTVFISVLIAGSIMSVNRKLLLKSILGYIPAILVGVVGAMVFGVAAGLLVGVSPGQSLSMYVLPIMGGGTGAGALPMSEMFEQTTGIDRTQFLSFAMPILAIGNVFSILMAALLNKLGQRKPQFSGNGELVKSGMELDPEDKPYEGKISFDEIGMGFLIVFGLYMAAVIISKKILPTIGGVAIHTYAYMLFLTAICNACNVFSKKSIAGLQKLQRFFSGQFLFIIMFSCGLAYLDLNAVIEALTPANIFIALMVVVGCTVGTFFFSYVVKFYPIETAITAGLCMANTGGTGDIAVLGACKRMNLMSFAQISSRIGGGLILVIASVVFAIFL